MSWAAVAVAGAAVVGAVVQNQGASRAADASARGSQAAIDEQRRQFDLMFGLGQPYQTTGVGANNALARLFGLPYQTGPSVAPSGPAPSGGGGRGGNRTMDAIHGLHIGGTLSGGDPVMGLLGAGIGGNLFGGRGDTERFDRAPHPGSGLGPTRYQPSDVVRLLQSGQTIDQIAQGGYLSPLEGDPTNRNDREINYLLGHLTPEQIGRLQGRQPTPTGPNAPGAVTTPTGPDMTGFFTSPGYQFRRDEGTRDIQNAFAARGAGQSGNALRALADFNQQLASGEFGNYVNTLMGLSGRGQAQANQTGQAALTTGANVGNALMQQGDARASGIVGQSNAINQGLNTGLNNWLLYQGGWFNRPTSPNAVSIQNPRGAWI